MGDFKKNPKKPFEVRVPNKIRKRIAMHQKDDTGLGKVGSLLMPLVVAAKMKGSLWSRFTNRVKKFLR
jgi:hypothetical protein